VRDFKESIYSQIIIPAIVMTTHQARTDEASRTRRPIKMEVDLCLYRVVSEQCGGRILPFGVRQMIKGGAAVVRTKTNRETTLRRYQRLGREPSD
jgi:hypothetical protein